MSHLTTRIAYSNRLHISWSRIQSVPQARILIPHSFLIEHSNRAYTFPGLIYPFSLVVCLPTNRLCKQNLAFRTMTRVHRFYISATRLVVTLFILLSVSSCTEQELIFWSSAVVKRASLGLDLTSFRCLIYFVSSRYLIETGYDVFSGCWNW